MSILKDNLKQEYAAATRLVRDIEKEMKSKTFKSLSQYSKDLVKKDYQNAISAQLDVVEKMTDAIFANQISQDEVESIIKTN